MEDLKPRDGIRSLNLLCNEFPQKTASEILAIQEKDRLEHDLYIHQQNQKAYDYADMVNDQGGIYYKGTFGLSQKYYYHFTDVEVEQGELYATVEEIVCHFGTERGTLPVGEVRFEKRKKSPFKNIDNYGISTLEETTKEKWEALDKYLEQTKSFWE